LDGVERLGKEVCGKAAAVYLGSDVGRTGQAAELD
jgi:hypothetical protein